MALLGLKNIKKSYKVAGGQKQDVLKGIDLEFKSGDLVALLGESGCGKSSLINILGGLDTDYTGSLVLHDQYIREYTEKQMDDYRKKRVGLIFQNYELIENLNIKDNVEIAMTICNVDAKVRSERAEDLLKLVGLLEFKDKTPNQLSGGQKQRVAIARSLANNPTIILADEPTGALDADSAKLVMDILTKIAESGKLVIIVTHSQVVAGQCSRIIKLENGVVASDESSHKLKVASTRDKYKAPKNMPTSSLFALAQKNVKQKKGRSALISFGMAIAMTMVLLILCLSSGIASYVTGLYDDTGATTLLAYNSDFSTINSADIAQLLEQDEITSISESHTFAYPNYTYEGVGGYAGYLFTVTSDTIAFDMSSGSDVNDDYEIVINSTLAYALSNGGGVIDSIGKYIDFYGTQLKIVGVYSDLTDFSTYSVGYTTSTAMSNIASSTKTNTLTVTISDISVLETVEFYLGALGLSYTQAENSALELLEYIDLATQILIAVGAVSLFVSAVMIFIVLTISISERKKEIGLLRAIGGRKSDIVKLFVFEAICLGFVGGIFALGASLLISSIVNLITYFTLEAIFLSYSIPYYLICFGASILIGTISGIAPSFKASQLDPVECLRGE